MQLHCNESTWGLPHQCCFVAFFFTPQPWEGCLIPDSVTQEVPCLSPTQPSPNLPYSDISAPWVPSLSWNTIPNCWHCIHLCYGCTGVPCMLLFNWMAYHVWDIQTKLVASKSVIMLQGVCWQHRPACCLHCKLWFCLHRTIQILTEQTLQWAGKGGHCSVWIWNR